RMLTDRLCFIASRNPNFAPAMILAQRLVMKVQPEFAQLPQMIGDIFPRISHRPIRTHNDLIRIVISLLLSPGLPVPLPFFRFHHPASLAAAFGLVNYCAARFEFLESARPEMQMQNLFLS